ncbi:MAG: hypothetical protein ABI385_13065, partial [Lapillicoccus sp.]
MVADPVDSRYAALGGPSGPLGPATSGRVSVGGGVYQQYRSGRIWWNGADTSPAWETLGTIDVRYAAIRGP